MLVVQWLEADTAERSRVNRYTTICVIIFQGRKFRDEYHKNRPEG